MAKFIDYKVSSGEENMRLDSDILDEAIKDNYKEPIIRFYGWSPKCVSLGRNQAQTNINTEFCKLNNIDTVRRVTGGRGLLHDDEVTYSFVCPIDFLQGGESIIKSYKEISSAIIEGFKTIGIELQLGGKKKVNTSFDYCMSISTGADLSYNDKKLIGSAQFRKQNYLLQHGSILFSYDKDLLEKIFNEKTDTNTITCIKEINPDLTRVDIVNAMKIGFRQYFKLL
ncbi:lipoate--protein ligase family protein [bacterium]|nr:lipoate--protein ligase family protein [bacterium]